MLDVEIKLKKEKRRNLKKAVRKSERKLRCMQEIIEGWSFKQNL